MKKTSENSDDDERRLADSDDSLKRRERNTVKQATWNRFQRDKAPAHMGFLERVDTILNRIGLNSDSRR